MGNGRLTKEHIPKTYAYIKLQLHMQTCRSNSTTVQTTFKQFLHLAHDNISTCGRFGPGRYSSRSFVIFLGRLSLLCHNFSRSRFITERANQRTPPPMWWVECQKETAEPKLFPICRMAMYNASPCRLAENDSPL